MSQPDQPHILIIGNGISGITAARRIRERSDAHITVVSGESPTFFSRTGLMYVYLGQLRQQDLAPYEPVYWKYKRIELIHDHVQAVDAAARTLRLASGQTLSFDRLVIASGSVPAVQPWPGLPLKGVQGFYSLQDLVLLEENTHRNGTPPNQQRVREAVIVGGGLIGIEVAEMLLSRSIRVSMLVREPHYWGHVLSNAESALLENHFRSHGVTILTCTEMTAAHGDHEGRVSGISTTTGAHIPCQLLCIATGVRPQIDFLRGSGIALNRGVLVNEFLETSIPGCYAIGDCAEHKTPPAGRNSIEQTWYTGGLMGETVAATLTGQPTPYRPGPWFNSAKFFDLEYQVYGAVPTEISEAEAELRFHADSRMLRLVYNRHTGCLTGISSIGIRLKHRVCEAWLCAGTDKETVISQLEAALFEPEFSRTRTRHIQMQLLRDVHLTTSA